MGSLTRPGQQRMCLSRQKRIETTRGPDAIAFFAGDLLGRAMPIVDA
jgi:hypothetical protein